MDGKLVPFSEANVHVLSHALHYGYGAFEGIRAYEQPDGKAGIWRLDEHIERFLDFPLGFGIDCRGRFVEDENAWIRKQCASDRDALAFASGERLASFAHERIVPIGELKDEIVGLGRACRGDDLLAGRIGASISDILGDRAEEQKRLLKNDAYIAAVFADRVFADIDTIDANRAACHIVEAANKVDQGAFSCAAWAD
jgi:hypothetical protein